MSQIPAGSLYEVHEYLKSQVQTAEDEYFQARNPVKLLKVQKLKRLESELRQLRRSHERGFGG